MTDCALTLLANLIARHERPEDVPPRGTRRADLGLWRCADGKWLCTTDMEPRYWATFCEVLGKPEFIPWQLDPARRALIREELQALFATAPRAHWLDLLGRAGTQYAPVNDLAEALAEPHFHARGMVIVLDAPGGALTQIAPPVRLGPFVAPDPAVPAGTHTRDVLAAIGLPDAEISALVEAARAQQTGRPSPASH